MDNANYTEVFKDIPHYEGRYQISNKGTVWSVIRNRKMKLHRLRNGYYGICLVDKYGKKRDELVHRLVALAFLPNPNHLPVVNHIDENKQNNWATNLEWCDYKYNNSYNNKGKRISDTKRDNSSQLKQFDLKGNLIRVYNSLTDAAEENAHLCRNGKAESALKNISLAALGKNKSAYGFIWCYA